jgi:hypothetical protein
MQDWECIVCDDGSSEEERAKLEALCAAQGPRFRLDLSVPCGASTGPSAARNRGIRQAQGEYVAFCDDDDFWTVSDHLSTAVGSMRAAGADLFFASQTGVNNGATVIADWFQEGREWLTRRPPLPSHPAVHTVNYPDFIRGTTVRNPCLNTVLLKREFLFPDGLLWEAIRYNEDVDFVRRAADRARAIVYRPTPVAEVSITPHERAYSASNALERALIAAMSMQHLRAFAVRPETRRQAVAIEAWALLTAAREVRKSGNRPAAQSFLRQSLLLRPSRTALTEWLRGIFS